MSNKINSLETLRGFAALIVAFYHFPSASYLYIQNGDLAVYFFFTLSGFVICLNYFEKINNVKDILKFQIKRFFRLYPIHIFVLLIIIIIQFGKFFAINYLEISSGSPAFAPENIFSLNEFFRHLLLIQAVYKDGFFLSWNGAAWTISTEFYTYLFFGFLTLITKNNKMFFTIFAIFYIFFYEILEKYIGVYLNSMFIQCIKYFLTGCVFYFIFQKINFRINDLLFVLIITLLLFLNKLYFPIENNILFCLIILFVSILKNQSLINKFLNFRPLVYFGSISYSFYMIHQSILYLLIQILKFVFKVQFIHIDGTVSNTGNIYYDTLIMITYIFFSLIASSFMYKYIELKFRK